LKVLKYPLVFKSTNNFKEEKILEIHQCTVYIRNHANSILKLSIHFSTFPSTSRYVYILIQNQMNLTVTASTPIHSHSLFVSYHVGTSSSPKRSWLTSCTTKAQQQQQPKEIRVCTNRACRKQGSFQTLETISGIAPPNVSVKSSGCLGKCGAGPNLVVLPDYLIIRYCGTAARCLETMVSLFGGGDNCLDALALRKKADVEFEKKNFAEAELLLSQVHI